MIFVGILRKYVKYIPMGPSFVVCVTPKSLTLPTITPRSKGFNDEKKRKLLLCVSKPKIMPCMTQSLETE